MRYGSPWSSGWGSPENHFLYCIPDTAGLTASGNTYLPVSMQLRSGLDNGAFVGIYRNAQFVKNVQLPTAAPYKAIVDVPWGTSRLSVMPLRIGHLSDPSYHDEKVVRVYETTENARITVQFTFTPKVFVPPLSDGGFTSNWSLTGLAQGQNCAYVNGHPSWGRFGLTLTVSGGNCMVILTNSGSTVASGTAAIGGAPFSVTLAAQNGSGISGSVTVSNTVASVTGGTVDIRWPASIQVLRDTVDPPTTVRDTILFRGLNTVRWTESVDLAAGTYYYRAQPVSDTGVTGTQTTSATITTLIAPNPPTNIAYSSGNAAATVLSFTASTTGGATYRLYLATAVSGVANFNDIKATAIAGATSIIMPVITGYAGTVYAIVRAVSGGIEERNLNMLALEYDGSGVFVPARPNVPTIETVTVASGRTVTVRGLYNTDHEKGTATTLQLWSRTPSGTSASVVSASLASIGNGLKVATINFTYLADGYYYIKLVAVTAGSVTSITANSTEMLILVSNDMLPAPGSFTANLSRG